MIEFDYTRYRTAATPSAPCVYFVNMHVHPMDFAGIIAPCRLNVVSFYVSDWDADLSPWPAKGLYKGDPDFRGDALGTLYVLEHDRIPTIERAEGLTPSRRAIAGYSMGGLFSTYAFLTSTYFDAMASMSGSLWFEGWPDYLAKMCARGAADHAFDGRFAYFSIGSKERKSPPKILSSVEERNRETAEALEAAGAQTEFVLGPGNHFQHMLERCMRGFDALERFYFPAGPEAE